MNIKIDIRYLSPQFYSLSKTTFVKGQQCFKYLYLLKYKPKEKTPADAATLQKFAQGRDFEANFKANFQNGIDVVSSLGKDVYALGTAYTQAILDAKQATSIFEACFIYNKTLVMVDVCSVNEAGQLTLFEVKNSLVIKDVFVEDMAIQYYVIQQATNQLVQFNLVLNDGNDGFKQIDMTEILAQKIKEIGLKAEELLKIVSEKGKEPTISMGEQCHKPYDCEYIAYCSKKK